MTSHKTASVSNRQWPHWLSIFLFAIIIAALWIFNQPYITPLLLGFIFAALSYPIHNFLLNKIKFEKIKASLAAIVTILVLSTTFITIINVMTRELVKEVPKFGIAIINFLDELPDNESVLDFSKNFNLTKDDVREGVEVLKSRAFINTNLTSQNSGDRNISEIFSQENINNAFGVSRQAFNYVFTQLLYLVIFYLAWFNGLVYGKKWLDDLFEITPLVDSEIKEIKQDLTVGIRNVIYASLLSGGIHTVVVVLVMLFFGLPNVTIVAIAVFLIGLLPLSPSELGYAIPIILLFQVNPLAAIIFIPIAELIILYINYVLLPKVIAGGESGNPLLILTSIFTGLVIFGIMGFIIAPVLMILIQTLYKILVSRIREEKDLLIQNKALNS